MKLFILFALSMLFPLIAFSQDVVPIEIVFEKDDSIVTVSTLTAEFKQDASIIKLVMKGSTLHVPKTLFNAKGTISFCINKKNIQLRGVPIAWNELNLSWVVGLDTKPFNKQKFWTKKNWKGVKHVYYIDYNNGKMVTDFD